jgi:hypothetical protein
MLQKQHERVHLTQKSAFITEYAHDSRIVYIIYTNAKKCNLDSEKP